MERGSRKRSSSAGSEKMESVGGRWEKMEGHCSTGQSPQRAVVPMEEEDYIKMHGRMNVKIATFILISATDRSELLTSEAGFFTPGKEPQYPLHRGLGRYHSRSEQWRRENSHPLPGFEPQTVAQSLHRPRNARSHKQGLIIVLYNCSISVISTQDEFTV